MVTRQWDLQVAQRQVGIADGAGDPARLSGPGATIGLVAASADPPVVARAARAMPAGRETVAPSGPPPGAGAAVTLQTFDGPDLRLTVIEPARFGVALIHASATSAHWRPRHRDGVPAGKTAFQPVPAARKVVKGRWKPVFRGEAVLHRKDTRLRGSRQPDTRQDQVQRRHHDRPP